MLYVDQPFGTGFSDEFGSPESDVSYDSGEDTEGNAGPSANSEGIFNPLEVNSTVSAAASVWKFLQAFYDEFPQYGNRDFGIFTEAYGGHYGSEFADYFQSQNKGIAAGSVTGHKISLVALGINNGWFDSAIQEKAYIDFSLNNTYKPLINESFSATVLQGYNEACLPAMQNCTSLTADDMDCYMADYLCQTAVDVPLLGSFGADFNVYDIREDVPQPSAQYATYLQRFDVMKAIGAKGQYRDCSRNVSDNFIAAGDRKSPNPCPLL
jgi:carboxypeptidase C (cathepsin A)